MSRSQKPRTPRYFPRMKVRGARRKRMRTMHLFQRIGDTGRVAGAAINAFGAALINMQDAINRMYERQAQIERLYSPTDPHDLADLGTAILKEDHGSN